MYEETLCAKPFNLKFESVLYSPYSILSIVPSVLYYAKCAIFNPRVHVQRRVTVVIVCICLSVPS